MEVLMQREGRKEKKERKNNNNKKKNQPAQLFKYIESEVDVDWEQQSVRKARTTKET